MDFSSLFSRKRGSDGAGQRSTAKRDPRKANRFFEHAEAVAGAHNYDYAIECYVSGLRHDPDNVNKHQALRDVALRRKVGGGKPAPLGERFKTGGASALDRMFHTEQLWSKDPLNLRLARDFLKRCVEADEAEPDLQLGEVVYWAAELVMDFAGKAAKPDAAALTEARDALAQVGAYAKAVDACKMLLRVKPNDDNLLMDLKNLEAERTMQEGGYSRTDKVEEGDFRNFVRDAEKQKALDQEDRIVKRESDVDQIIDRRRAEYEEDPQDLDRLSKLVDALLNRDADEPEAEAMQLLKRAWDQSGQYRYKTRLGDVKMRQYNRHLRLLREKAKKADDATAIKQKIAKLNKEKLAFELQEYEERVKHYPTDLGLRYELGRRLYHADRLDEAISAFQQAKADPKHRAAAHEYLGTCYLRKGWNEEAIDTLRTGIEAHPHEGDRIGLALRYLLMDALEKQARATNNAEQAREAQKLASQILQTKIDYRDIQKRLEAIRTLAGELEAKA
ncbi:MAG: hypothetical protein ACODAQ_07650 [Phycisphaeraceae bacterium]